MTERYLAIIEKDHETDQITLIHNYGICEKADYDQRMAQMVQAEQDWDMVLNVMLAELINHGFLTEKGIEKSFNFGSVLGLIRDNAELFLNQPGQKKDLKTTAVLKALDVAMMMFDKGKEIDLKMHDIARLNEQLSPAFTRQLLRDEDRRDWLRSVMPLSVLAYESKFLQSGN